MHNAGWEALPMNSIYDLDDPPVSKHEVAKAKQSAKQLLQRRTKQAIYATAIFFLSCASVSPFLKGHPLHAYWESFGKYLVLLSMGLLIPFVIYVGRAITAWLFVRDVEKMNS
jgi:hypothetical protein